MRGGEGGGGSICIRGVGTLSTLGGANFSYQNMNVAKDTFYFSGKEIIGGGGYSPPSPHGSYTYVHAMCEHDF